MQGMPQNPNHKIELMQGQLEVYKISKEKLYSRCLSHHTITTPYMGIGHIIERYNITRNMGHFAPARL